MARPPNSTTVHRWSCFRTNIHSICAPLGGPRRVNLILIIEAFSTLRLTLVASTDPAISFGPSSRRLADTHQSAASAQFTSVVRKNLRERLRSNQQTPLLGSFRLRFAASSGSRAPTQCLLVFRCSPAPGVHLPVRTLGFRKYSPHRLMRNLQWSLRARNTGSVPGSQPTGIVLIFFLSPLSSTVALSAIPSYI